MRQLLAEEGWKGLMRGTTGTLAREVPGNAVFFTVYESLRQNLPGRPPHEASIGVLGVLKDSASAIFCGGIAGMVYSLLLCACIVKMPSVGVDLNCASTRMLTGDVDVRAAG